MGNTGNILLIEDNPADSRLINIYLEDIYQDKYAVMIADTLVKGIQIIKEIPVDILILDLSLLDSWGLETLDKLHAEESGIPIIVLTGLEGETVGVDAVKMGAQDFLIKGNLNKEVLRRSINYSIERHKLLQSLSARAKELEEKTLDLQKEKQKLALAHKIAKIGSWEWDFVAGKVTWSDELFSILGLEPSKAPFSFDELLDRIHPEDRNGILDIIEKSKHDKKPLSFYYRIIRNDGSIRTFYSLGEVLTNEEGKAVKIVGTRQDVTERMEEEEMQKLVMAATQSFNSVSITKKNGTIEWVNEGFTKLTGYKLDEVKDTRGEILRRGDSAGISQDAENYDKVVKRKVPVTYESKNYSKDSREYHTITTLTPVLDNNGNVGRIIAIDTDITQRKQMEEDLRRANSVADELLEKTNVVVEDLKSTKKELEETMQVKEQFLANMSHEIRTPMNAVIGFTRLLMKISPTVEQKHYIDIIRTSGMNLLVIVNDILDFSKLRSGKINFEQIEFNLSEALSSLIELLKPKTLGKNIKLVTDIDSNISEYVIGDPTRLNQILMNLLGNAIKFTKRGEVKLKVEIIKENPQDIQLKFSVIDSGIGIAEDILPTIFEAFTQAGSETTRKYGGTGLGLAIVKQLVEQQQGTITVSSKINKGSIFCFTLNLKKGTGILKKKKNIAKELIRTIPTEELKVLLVEDNELNAILAEKVISDWNWKVHVAENGFVALEKIQQEDFDIVLMDVQLPEMDGYQTTRKIRTEFPSPKKNIPIIAMTAHALPGEEEKCIEAGMDGYISKPFDPEKLYLKILTALHLTHLTTEDIKSTSALIPKNKHTDLTYMRELAKGSDAFMAQILNVFIEQTPLSIEQMEKAVKDREWKLLSQTVHKIKPSIIFTGLTAITDDIPLLEEYAANESNIDEIPALVDKIKTVCMEAIVELKEDLKKLEKVID